MGSQDCDRLFTAMSVRSATSHPTALGGSRTEVLFNTWGKFQSSRTNTALVLEKVMEKAEQMFFFLCITVLFPQ